MNASNEEPQVRQSSRLVSECIAVCGLLLLAALLRFWNIQNLGIFTIDEGRYTLDALAKLRELEVWTTVFAGKWGELTGGPPFLLSETLPELHAAMARNTVFFSKGLAAYLSGAFMLLTGYTTWTGNLLEAVCGVLTVAALYGWVRRLLGVRAALFAAAILTFSVYHGYFARNAYPQALPGLLLMGSLWLHTEFVLRKRLRWAFAAGLVWGLGFWASYQLTLLVPAMAVAHGAACLAAHPPRKALHLAVCGGLLWLAGHALAVAIAEAASYPTMLLFRQEGLLYPHRTFLQLQLPRVRTFVDLPADLTGLVYFPYLLWRAEGWGIAVLAGFALFMGGRFMIWQRRLPRGAILLALSYFVPLTLLPYLLTGTRGMWNSRPYMLLLPMGAALIAMAFAAAWRHGISKAMRAGAVLALTAYALTALQGQAQLLQMCSAYPEVMAWLSRQEEPAACASYGTLLASYLTEAGLEGGSYESLKGGGNLPPYFIEDASQLHYQQIPGNTDALPAGAVFVAAFHQTISPVFLAMEGVPRFGRPLEGIRYIAGLDPAACGRIIVYRMP